MQCPNCRVGMKRVSSITGYFFADNAILLLVFEVLGWVVALGLCTLGFKGYIFTAAILIVLSWLHSGKRWFKCAICGRSEVA